MKLLTFAAILAAIVLMAFPTGSDSCGIPPPEPVFASKQRPARLGDEFLKGKIGVIQPSYGRRYLIGAYRMLSGKPFLEKDAEAMYLGGPNPRASTVPGNARAAWLNLRQGITAGRVPFLNPDRTKMVNGLLIIYPNCLDNAFETAVQTFNKREALWGANDPRLRDWANAQDQVFANCSARDPVIPDAPAPGMDPLLAADRHYQIAAAYFYAADWEQARMAFQEVAQEASSPWKGIAPYLIARSYIREGMIDENPAALREAEQQLQAIIHDPAHGEWREASQKLIDYVRLRIDPKPRLAELSAELTGAKASGDLAQSTDDFLYLYGHQTEDARKPVEDLAASSDLADWMLTFEGRAKDAGAHALARWQKTHNAVWLIAALAYGHDPEAIRAARATDTDTAEYEAVTYYGIRADSDRLEARTWADDALSHPLLLSTRNLILAERLAMARDWDEFLRFAPRSPEPKLELDDGREADADTPPVGSGTAPLFDNDAAMSLNREVPLSLWEDATTNARLPAHLQLQVAESAWVRALVLGRDREARALMERIVKLQPVFRPAAQDFLAAPNPEAARFSGVLLLLRTPGLLSFLQAGSDAPDLTKISHLGAIGWGFATGCLPDGPVLPPAKPAFLDPAQQAENAAEWQQMTATAPTGGGYLAAQALGWARSHPDDARIPEALHLVVQAGRRACRGQEPVVYGRAAFELLHRSYPKSEWTEKTKYWYQ